VGLGCTTSRNTLLKIKHIRLKEKYGEGEIPYEAKTGTGPFLLILVDYLYPSHACLYQSLSLLH
jgi:hypothetical protein